jgi:hypothetical protein
MLQRVTVASQARGSLDLDLFEYGTSCHKAQSDTSLVCMPSGALKAHGAYMAHGASWEQTPLGEGQSRHQLTATTVIRLSRHNPSAQSSRVPWSPQIPRAVRAARQPQPRRNDTQKRVTRLPQPQVRPTSTPNTTLASKPCARAKPKPPSGIPRRAPAPTLSKSPPIEIDTAPAATSPSNYYTCTKCLEGWPKPSHVLGGPPTPRPFK